MESGHSSDLLHTLRELIRRIGELAVQQRMQHYRPDGKLSASDEILADLERHIEELDTNSGSNSAHAPDDDASPHTLGHKYGMKTPMAGEDTPKEPNELSRHFESNRTDARSKAELGHRLQKRAWEHIYATLRAARAGDTKTAKLHADIANQAVHEAAHFLPPDEISDFVHQVKNKLDSAEEPTSHT